MLPDPEARRRIFHEFLRFGTIGGIGFLVDTACVYALRGSIGLYWGGAAAYLVSATWAWIGNRVWTFRGRGGGSMHGQWLRYLAANLVGFVLNRGTYFILITVSALCYQYPVLAIAGGVAVGMFMNFHLSRRYVFR